ncbi:hypothetical protein ACSBR1_029392 [Camellia fascicularis]
MQCCGQCERCCHGTWDSREAGRNLSLKKREVTKDGMEDRLSTGLVRESESLSDQKGGKYEKAEPRTRSSSMEKICESRIKNYDRNVSTDLRDVQSKGNKISEPLKADTDVSKFRRDPNVGAMDHSSYKFGQTTTYHEQVEAKMPHGMVSLHLRAKISRREAKVMVSQLLKLMKA